MCLQDLGKSQKDHRIKLLEPDIRTINYQIDLNTYKH